MAITWIKSLHKNKGKYILQTPIARIDYAENPDKTKEGELVKGYACVPGALSKNFYYRSRSSFAMAWSFSS